MRSKIPIKKLIVLVEDDKGDVKEADLSVKQQNAIRDLLIAFNVEYYLVKSKGIVSKINPKNARPSLVSKLTTYFKHPHIINNQYLVAYKQHAIDLLYKKFKNPSATDIAKIINVKSHNIVTIHRGKPVKSRLEGYEKFIETTFNKAISEGLYPINTSKYSTTTNEVKRNYKLISGHDLHTYKNK